MEVHTLFLSAYSLFDEVDASLEKFVEGFALEHSVLQECEVDELATDASAVRITLDDVTLNVDDNVTGISTPTLNGQQTKDDVYYNLSGQKVDGSYKGIVIKNGKKMVVK